MVSFTNFYDVWTTGGFNHQVCPECTKFEVLAEKIADKTSKQYREITAKHGLHFDKAVRASSLYSARLSCS